MLALGGRLRPSKLSRSPEEIMFKLDHDASRVRPFDVMKSLSSENIDVSPSIALNSSGVSGRWCPVGAAAAVVAAALAVAARGPTPRNIEPVAPWLWLCTAVSP